MAKLQKCSWHSVFGCAVCFYQATGGAAAMDGNYSIVSGNLVVNTHRGTNRSGNSHPSTTPKTDATFAQLLAALERDERPAKRTVALDSLTDDQIDMLREAIESVNRKPARRAVANDTRTTDPNKIYAKLFRKEIVRKEDK
jgi:hypothetical protein